MPRCPLLSIGFDARQARRPADEHVAADGERVPRWIRGTDHEASVGPARYVSAIPERVRASRNEAEPMTSSPRGRGPWARSEPFRSPRLACGTIARVKPR